jgi:phage terminase large subunit-like protein
MSSFVPEGASIDEKREVVEAWDELLRLWDSHAAYMFEPHPQQTLFLHPDRDVFPRIRVFQGGNRTGKTEIGILEDFAFAHGERPWDGTKTPLRVPNRGRIITSSYDIQKKVIEPKIKRLWPDDAIATMKRGQQGHLSEIHFKNGSWVDFLSYEQEPLKHEGADIDWLHADEPPPQDIWIGNMRGLVDRGGMAWITMTPLVEPWLMDEVIVRAKAQDPNFYFVQSTMYDNVGYGLTEKNVKDFESQLTEEEKMARIHGEWLVLQGLVYKEYRDHYFIGDAPSKDAWGGHLVRPFEIPPHWPRFMGCDPHDREPTHFLWVAINEEHEAFVYDELKLPAMTVKRMAEIVREREVNHMRPAARPIMRIIDPAAARKNNVLEIGSNIKDQFMQEGLYFYAANNELDAGHKKVRQYLEAQETMKGYKPAAFVFDTCTGFRQAMLRYLWDEHSSSSSNESRGPKQKPREKWKHFMDCFRYVLMANPRYYEQHRGERRTYTPANTRTGY